VHDLEWIAVGGSVTNPESGSYAPQSDLSETLYPLVMGTREDNLAAVKRYFDAAASANADHMLEPWTDDLVYEERFSDPPRRIEGKEATRSYFSKAGTVFRMSLEITEVHECLDPDKLVLEYKSHGEVLATGETYENSYIGVYRFRDGRIWRVSEFHNPLITQRSRPPGVVIEEVTLPT
jgi:ketosteroid isomerase-like protein